MSLKLLQSYESDESSSTEEINTENSGLHNFKKEDWILKEKGECGGHERLPLPAVLNKMFVSLESDRSLIDDPAQHDGRVRSFAHVRGNWASFVNISFNNSESVGTQKEILDKTLQDFPDHGIRICSDMHLSLTKTISLRHHWLDDLICSLKEKFCRFDRFDVVYDAFEAYVNDDKTRTFIGMKVHTSNHLQRLIRECDATLSEYNLEPYYEDASFHVSIAWTLGAQATWVKKSVLPHLNSEWRKALEEDSTLQLERIASICLKTGNKGYEFPLKA